MAEKFTWTIWGKDNKKTKKTIEEITKEEAEDKTLLGTAGGMDFFHCFYIASRHCKNFSDNVKYYRVCDKDEALSPKCSVTIDFYK